MSDQDRIKLLEELNALYLKGLNDRAGFLFAHGVQPDSNNDIERAEEIRKLLEEGG